jgi:hypothetical protein
MWIIIVLVVIFVVVPIAVWLFGKIVDPNNERFWKD